MCRDAAVPSKNPGHAVRASLVSLAHIVEQRGGDQLMVTLVAFEQPAGRCRGVHDIAGVLAQKECEESAAEVAVREFEIGGCGARGCLAELANPRAH